MLRHIFQLSFVLTILILGACSQSENSNAAISKGEASMNQRPKETIPYPSVFSDLEVPMIDNAYVLNTKNLKNTKNKAGMQIWERTDKSFDEVKAFYLENLPKNGWERKTDADKHSNPEQEADSSPVKYLVTKFLKEESSKDKRYVLLLNITDGNDGNITIIKILKEM